MVHSHVARVQANPCSECLFRFTSSNMLESSALLVIKLAQNKICFFSLFCLLLLTGALETDCCLIKMLEIGRWYKTLKPTAPSHSALVDQRCLACY